MKPLVILRRVRVENANSIASSVLGGVGIICHHVQLLTDSDNFGEHSLALTRNPLTKEGKTAPFNEEGKMHLEVSLLIECHYGAEDYAEDLNLEEEDDEYEDRLRLDIERHALGQRLAGGYISQIGAVEYVGLPDDAEQLEHVMRGVLYASLPGFALVDRSPLLNAHHAKLKKHDPNISQLQAWMDFGGLRHRAVDTDESENSEWNRVPLPETGWFVPLMLGYQAIAELQPPGSIDSARDQTVPFCAVEPIHGVGQWISPHRVSNIESLLWRYPEEINEGYRLINQFQTTPTQ